MRRFVVMRVSFGSIWTITVVRLGRIERGVWASVEGMTSVVDLVDGALGVRRWSRQTRGGRRCRCFVFPVAAN